VPHRKPRSSANSELASRRLAAGWTQEELAEAAGISKPMLWRLEHGKPPKLIRQLANVAFLLECSIADLLDPAWETWWRGLSSFDEPVDPAHQHRRFVPKRRVTE
jgi:transcriptional regulator with XRE-family HTH domain